MRGRGEGRVSARGEGAGGVSACGGDEIRFRGGVGVRRKVLCDLIRNSG